MVIFVFDIILTNFFLTLSLCVYLQEKNKVSLRNLSMVMRQLKTKPDDRQKLIADSVEKAKDALQLDVSDGTSWCKHSTFLFT